MTALPAVDATPLTESAAQAAFGAILDGEVPDTDIAEFLVALSDRGESAGEISSPCAPEVIA